MSNSLTPSEGGSPVRDQLVASAPGDPNAEPKSPGRRVSASPLWLVLIGLALFVVLALVRYFTEQNSLTSPNQISAALRATAPLLLAGLAGLWAERSGIVNIGIEGMMILGTWFGGWAAWQFGGWAGILCGILGGVLGGLIHALATVRFNVDHVISGVAINILAAGVVQFLSVSFFEGQQGGGPAKSPPQSSGVGSFTMPLLAGGNGSADLLGDLHKANIPVLSDLGGVLKGLLSELSYATILALLLVPITAFVLWRTKFGLQLRSSGEAPAAAESLGVKVARLRYSAMAISGGLAGFGGAFLAIVSSSGYQEGQTANRGFIGLAIMIFGNWRPVGLLGGAGLFGYTDSLQLTGSSSIPALLLFVGIALVVLAGWMLYRGKMLGGIVAGVVGIVCGVIWALLDTLPDDLVKITPYLVTLVVLAVASQRLRPPAHAGLPFRSGDNH